MTKNVGTFDRIVRIVLAVVCLILLGTGSVGGVLAWILGILTVVLLLTATISYCPLYAPLRISTRSKESTDR